MKSTAMRAILIALGLFAATAAAQAASDVVVTMDDAGKNVTVASGQALVVRLPGNAGTGYEWRLDGDLMPVLNLSGRTTEAGSMPGAPFMTIYSFTTGTPGTVTLKASYIRSWEKGVAPTRTYNITVTVSPP